MAATGEIRDARGKKRSDYQTFFEEGSSKTVQSDAHLADIQEILKTFGVVGVQNMLNATEERYMDISEFTDYADMMRHVKEADVEFMKLPSEVRGMFNHDVFTWLDTAHDERRDAPARLERDRAGDEAAVADLEVAVAPKAPAE